MSTKTSIKRIALVAATALTLGGFSVITSSSANALEVGAVTGVAFKSTPFANTDTASTTPGTATNPVAVTVVPNQTFFMDVVETKTVADSVTVYVATKSDFSDSATLLSPAAGTTSANNGTTAPYFGGTSSNLGTGRIANSDTQTTLKAPQTPGTYYLQMTVGPNAGGVAPVQVAGYAVVTVVNILATTYDGTVKGLGSSAVNAVAGPSNTVTLTVPRHSDKAGYVVVSGAGATISSVSTGQTVAAGATTATIAASAEDTVTVVVNTPSVGSITATYAAETAAGSGIASTTVATTTITVNATGSSGVLSVANSTVYDTTTIGGTAIAALSASAATVNSAVGTNRISYTWTLKDALSAAYAATATAPITATLTGPGLISASSSSGFARSASTTSGSTGTFYLQGDGSSGSTTITFSVGSTTIATKTATFYSSTVKSVSATVNQSIVNVAAVTGFAADTGTGGTVSYIAVTAKDSSGNAIPSLTNLVASSSSTSVLTVGTPVWDSTDLVYYVPVTGVAAGSATVTITDSTATYSATAKLSVAKAVVDTFSIAFGAASYNAGDNATLLITAKDSTGAAVADGYYQNVLSGAAAVSQSLTSTLFASMLHFVGGVATAKFFAPYNGGVLTANVYAGSSTKVLGTALQAEASAVAHTATAQINAAGGGDAALALDAANAATDAANNAYDEAQNATQAAQDALAAVTALAKQVSSLIASVKSLTALVSKIKAKVGA